MKLYVITFLLLLLTVLAPSKVLSQDDNELERARTYLDVANGSNNLDTIKSFSRMAIAIAKKRGDVALMRACADNLAYVYGVSRVYDSAIIYYKQVYIIISDDTTKKSYMATTLGNLGICYKNLDKYMDMWNCFREGKVLFEELNDTSSICWTSLEMGEAYEHFGMFQQAREYYCSALSLAQSINSIGDIARGHYSIGNSILSEHFANDSDSVSSHFLLARDYMKVAIDESKDLGGYSDTVRCLSLLSLAKCYMSLYLTDKKSEYVDSCRQYLNRYIESKPSKPLSDSLSMETLKAMLMVAGKKYKDAIPVLESASKLPVKAAYMRDMSRVYKWLSKCYSAIGKGKDAYFARKKYFEISNKISNEENIKRSANFAAQTEIDFERERHASDIMRREARDKESDARLKNIIKILIVGLVIAMVIGSLFIFMLRRKRHVNKELKERNDELLSQYDIIEKQKNDEQAAQSIILSSVEYASKIQSLAIGNVESVAAVCPESFVYYRPRNIVSGDWYMATMLRGHRIMIEADCTGHGIPGGLLCMLGVSAMKDIINQLRHTSSEIMPGLILDDMRVAIKKAFNKDIGDSKTVIDDGMDMTIVVLPPEGKTLLFGGACQSAILVSDGKTVRLKGDTN
ncbi:MAG: hypothetical protein II480_11925, partial [Bacteroidales bacterium]|nr:hypothetical protein [Bacteroidales bacterium]